MSEVDTHSTSTVGETVPKTPSPDGQPPEDDNSDGWEPEGDLVELEPPRMDTRFYRQLWRTRRYLKKRQKLIGDGYVRWHLIGDSFQRPKFIKPERKGGGIPEKEVDGETYLFPKQAMVPSENGMWTVVHREGEADPINLKDPVRLSIDSDRLKEYLDLRVSSSAPGLLDGLGLDSGDLLKIAVALIILFALAQNFM